MSLNFSAPPLRFLAWFYSYRYASPGAPSPVLASPLSDTDAFSVSGTVAYWAGYMWELAYASKSAGTLNAWDTLPAICCDVPGSASFFLLAPMLSNGTDHTGCERAAKRCNCLRSAAIVSAAGQTFSQDAGEHSKSSSLYYYLHIILEA